jgi:adenylate kinase family enzyme
MQRVVVIGASGSGKSTFALDLATRLHVPFVELDALHHGAGWMARPTFAEDVDAATRGSAWVVDGNYAAVRDLLWSRADTVVWLDLSRWIVEARAVRRSLLRWVRRTPLWNGNREPSPIAWLDPEHPVRWAWKKHREYRVSYQARFMSPAWERLARIRLRSRAEVRAFLEQAPGAVRPVGERAPGS